MNRKKAGLLWLVLMALTATAIGAEVGDKFETTDKAVICPNPLVVDKARKKPDDCELLSALHCVRAQMGLHVLVLDPHSAPNGSMQISVTTLKGEKVTAYTDAASLDTGDYSELMRKAFPDKRPPCSN